MLNKFFNSRLKASFPLKAQKLIFKSHQTRIQRSFTKKEKTSSQHRRGNDKDF